MSNGGYGTVAYGQYPVLNPLNPWNPVPLPPGYVPPGSFAAKEEEKPTPPGPKPVERPDEKPVQESPPAKPTPPEPPQAKPGPKPAPIHHPDPRGKK